MPIVDEDNINVSNGSNLPTQQLESDVSGHYVNPTYGIVDFVIPNEWYGSERQWSGDQSISLDMRAGTEAEYTDRLISPTSATSSDIIPTMLLESTDKAKLQQTQSLLGEMSPISDMGSATSQCMSIDGRKVSGGKG